MQRLKAILNAFLFVITTRPVLPILVVSSLACGPSVVLFATTPTPQSGSVDRVTEFPATPGPEPTTAFIEPSPTPLPISPEFVSNEEGLRIFPGPVHYEGDVLSIEVPVTAGLQSIPVDASPTLWIDGRQIDGQAYEVEHPLLSDFFEMPYVWDTTGKVGTHDIRVELPINDTGRIRRFMRTIEILPASERPEVEQNAEWEVRETDCCILYYLSGTAAGRDIDELSALADDTIADVERQFPGVDVDHFPIVLIDNMWGNGAYATGSEIVISYVDRAYNALDMRNLIYHEGVHYATSGLSDDTPIMLTEGIAVYLTGGHYRQEPVPQRAAALLALDMYVPLDELVSEFRAVQHEVAYVQAAAFIAYLVDLKGWDVFLDLYASDSSSDNDRQWLERGLDDFYGLTLSQAEVGFLDWLQAIDPGGQVENLALTVELFDTMREYQRRYASYAQLPSISEAVENDLVYQFVREPVYPENIAIELALIEAQSDLAAGRYDEVAEMLGVVEDVLDSADFNEAPLNTYLSVTRYLLDAGYEPQTITLSGSHVEAEVIAIWPELQTLDLNYANGEWQVLN